MSDIDTQIESLLQPYHSDDRFICDTIDGKPCNCSVKIAHKAIKTLLIQSKIDIWQNIKLLQEQLPEALLSDLNPDNEIKALKEELET